MEDIMHQKMLLGCLCLLKNQFIHNILSPNLLLHSFGQSFIQESFYVSHFPKLHNISSKSVFISTISSNKSSFVMIFQLCRRSNYTEPSSKRKPHNNSSWYSYTKLQQWRYQWHEWLKSGLQPDINLKSNQLRSLFEFYNPKTCNFNFVFNCYLTPFTNNVGGGAIDGVWECAEGLFSFVRNDEASKGLVKCSFWWDVLNFFFSLGEN